MKQKYIFDMYKKNEITFPMIVSERPWPYHGAVSM